MRIGILTYNKPHKKTQDVIYGLHRLGYKKIKLIISKFKKFKNKQKYCLFNHRPFQFVGSNYEEISKYYGYKYCDFNSKNVFRNLDIALICGSSIISKSMIKQNFIINCHSGLIPLIRGLDAFKWAIFKDQPLGNTLHYIDEGVDMGKIISHKITPIYKSDNLYDLSERHYNYEVKMLINFEKYLNKSKVLDLNISEPNMRMPLRLEKKMINKFNIYKSKFSK